MKWPKLICIFGLYDIVKLFDICQQILDDTIIQF